MYIFNTFYIGDVMSKEQYKAAQKRINHASSGVMELMMSEQKIENVKAVLSQIKKQAEDADIITMNAEAFNDLMLFISNLLQVIESKE